MRVKKIKAHIRVRADFPGVSCKACEQIKTMDNILPACETSPGCIIPALGTYEWRLMDTYNKLVGLKGLMGIDSALYGTLGLTRSDLPMLCFIDETIREVFKTDDSVQPEH